MAGIFNTLLAGRKRDTLCQEKILNTRWGDAAISAPMHKAWNGEPLRPSQPSESPDLDHELPSTPPQPQEGVDGVYIIHGGDAGLVELQDEAARYERDNITITIPLPWKKKAKTTPSPIQRLADASKHTSIAPYHTLDLSSPPPKPATMDAAGISEVYTANGMERPAVKSTCSAFRSCPAASNLGDGLSPVVEGFAKNGPSSRPVPNPSSLHYVHNTSIDRPSTASSMRSIASRRSSLKSHPADEIAAEATNSQAVPDAQESETSRPPSRGIGVTAYMRASSQGPKAGSRRSRPSSVDLTVSRSMSVEPVSRAVEAQHTSMLSRVTEPEPLRRRAPSVERMRRRAPSADPVTKRFTLVEAVQTVSAPIEQPVRRRTPVETVMDGRAASYGPRGRTGLGVQPIPRTRFHSEAPYMSDRPGSFSSYDGSVEAESDTENPSEAESLTATTRLNREPHSARRPQRRRSIAGPVTSPTAAVHVISRPSQMPKSSSNFIITPAILPMPTNNIVSEAIAHHNLESRARGLYADMQNDYRLVGQDARKDTTAPKCLSTTALMEAAQTELPGETQESLFTSIRRPLSRALMSNPPNSMPIAPKPESSLSGIIAGSTPTSRETRLKITAGDEAVRQTKGRDKRRSVASPVDGYESIVHCWGTGHETPHRKQGENVIVDIEYDGYKLAGTEKKTMVPSGEEIWG